MKSASASGIEYSLIRSRRKTADIVIWDGDPLDARSRVRYTIIDGETVYSA